MVAHTCFYSNMDHGVGDPEFEVTLCSMKPYLKKMSKTSFVLSLLSIWDYKLVLLWLAWWCCWLISMCNNNSLLNYHPMRVNQWEEDCSFSWAMFSSLKSVHLSDHLEIFVHCEWLEMRFFLYIYMSSFGSFIDLGPGVVHVTSWKMSFTCIYQALQ